MTAKSYLMREWRSSDQRYHVWARWSENGGVDWYVCSVHRPAPETYEIAYEVTQALRLDDLKDYDAHEFLVTLSEGLLQHRVPFVWLGAGRLVFPIESSGRELMEVFFGTPVGLSKPSLMSKRVHSWSITLTSHELASEVLSGVYELFEEDGSNQSPTLLSWWRKLFQWSSSLVQAIRNLIARF